MNISPQFSAIAASWVLCILSAIAVVTVSFECRILSDQLMQLKTRQQQLQVEWGRLLLEESAFAEHSRLEDIAVAQLGMRRPSPGEVRVVGP